MSEQLKQCPFCGSGASLSPDGDGSLMWVWCANCESGGPAVRPPDGRNIVRDDEMPELERRACESWNKRAVDELLVDAYQAERRLSERRRQELQTALRNCEALNALLDKRTLERDEAIQRAAEFDAAKLCAQCVHSLAARKPDDLSTGTPCVCATSAYATGLRRGRAEAGASSPRETP